MTSMNQTAVSRMSRSNQVVAGLTAAVVGVTLAAVLALSIAGDSPARSVASKVSPTTMSSSIVPDADLDVLFRAQLTARADSAVGGGRVTSSVVPDADLDVLFQSQLADRSASEVGGAASNSNVPDPDLDVLFREQLASA